MRRAVRGGLVALALAAGFFGLLGVLFGPVVIVALAIKVGRISAWWSLASVAWTVFCLGALFGWADWTEDG